MEAMVAIMIAVLVGTGVYLVLRARTFPVILGITLLSYGVNLFVFISGRLALDQAPIVGRGPATDPLPQALVLTAIVIGFAMTAFSVILAIRARSDLGSDHVNGNRLDEPREESS